MFPTKIHLMDLVRQHDAESASWKYTEDTDHVVRGVMCWVVTLHNAYTEPPRTYGWDWVKPPRVKAHTFKLAYGAQLITDEYVAHLVNQRLEQAL